MKILGDFWRGFAAVWEGLYDFIMVVLRVHKWDWEAMGFLLGMIIVAVALFVSFAFFLKWLVG
jgi:hypothetical protein